MKKALIAGGAILLLAIIALFWLASGASPDNAPQDVKVIDLPDAGNR